MPRTRRSRGRPRSSARGRGGRSERGAPYTPQPPTTTVAVRSSSRRTTTSSGGAPITDASSVSLPVSLPSSSSIADLPLDQFLSAVRQVVQESHSNSPHPSAPTRANVSASSDSAVPPLIPAAPTPAAITTLDVPGATMPSGISPNIQDGAQFGVLPPPEALTDVGVSPATSQLIPDQLPQPLSGAGETSQLPLDVSARPGLSLSMSLRPIPARIVNLVRTGRYVEMRELLGDNVAVRGHLDDIRSSMGTNILQLPARPRVREVTTLPSWICCFLLYLAVGTTDLVTRDRLAYAVLLVRESLRHGGAGWLEYDRMFRQQAALDPALPWNLIHPSLQATTILAHRAYGSGSFCNICQDCDHSASACALAQLQQQSTNSRGQPGRQQTRTTAKYCTSWNEGACSHPGTCVFRHICSVCHQAGHPACDCRQRPKPGPPTSRSSSLLAPRPST